MRKSLSPLKKRKVEIDFEKCLLCQSDEKSEYRKPNVENVVDLAIERNKYKDAHVSEFSNRISKCGHTAECLVIEKNCIFHKSCYADHGNTSKRDIVKQMYEKTILTGDIHVSRRNSGIPPKRSSSYLVKDGIM